MFKYLTILFCSIIITFYANSITEITLPEGTKAKVIKVETNGKKIVKAVLAQATIINTSYGKMEFGGFNKENRDTLTFYDNGVLESGFISKPYNIETKIGKLQFSSEYLDYNLYFNNKGKILSGGLAKNSKIKTHLGEYECMAIAFTNDGLLDRIEFCSPQFIETKYGKYYFETLTFSKNNSFNGGRFRDITSFDTSYGKYSFKFINWYDSGKVLMGYTPNNEEISTKYGKILFNTIYFYENGNLKELFSAEKTEINDQIYEKFNSIYFKEDGEIINKK